MSELVFDISQEEMPIFLAETDDHLQVLDEGLVRLEREEDDPELMQAMFRAAHTLKGMAGMIGHKRLVDLTHALETAFDSVRKHQLHVTTGLIDICLRAVDALRLLRTEVVHQQLTDVDVASLVAEIKEFIASPRTTAGATSSVQSSSAQTLTPPQTNDHIEIFAEISQSSIASAARAFQIMMALQNLGEIVQMTPSQAQIESAAPCLTFLATLKTTKTKEEIYRELADISEIDRIRIQGEVMGIAHLMPSTSAPAPEKSTIPSTAEAVQPQPVEIAPAPSSGKSIQPSPSKEVDKTVRTSVERLDNLMNLVGELITDRNRLNQLRAAFEAQNRGNEQVNILSETITHVGRITDQLQEEVMRIRMVPVSNVFNKFPRLVRDLSQKTNKEIDLVIRGQETEMDRSVIEEINDPLIHLIRNAIDHGIEVPAERVAAGKSPRGQILLTARHEQGRIILTVEDDGKGIDTERLKQSAIQRGMLNEADAASLSPEKAIDLIFMSGVSTAKLVTDISGRGVGMDIVRNNIERINGSILVETTPGKGSRFQIVLPLTLAIVPTLLVRVNPVVFAIPMVTVVETQRIKENEIQTIAGRPVIILRNHVLPLVKLSTLFNLPTPEKSEERVHYIVVVTASKLQIGFVVDTLIGEEEVVVKSLGALIGEVAGISSAAILGDGQIALITDVQGIFKLAGLY
ncbi:MAG TPA: chemotaxis protein CheA [Anaerolineaceae bacterium]